VNPTQALKLTYMHLIEQMRLAFELITDHATDIQAHVFQLPHNSNDDIGKAVQDIHVTPVEGKQAFLLTRQHYFKHKLDVTRSGRLLTRLPGIVKIQHPRQEECVAMLHQVNQTKQEIKSLIQAVPGNKTERFETIAKVLPDLVKLQVTRQLLFIDTPAKSVGFSWVNRNAMQHMTKQVVIDKLTVTNEYAKQKQGLSDFYDMAQKEQQYISSFPDNAAFTIRRPLRVAPMMNIHYRSPKTPIIEAHKNPPNMVAHSPLLLFNHAPGIHPLARFERHQFTDDHASMPLVIPRLHLYQVQ
jgi:DNA replication terminus site-binding protein